MFGDAKASVDAILKAATLTASAEASLLLRSLNRTASLFPLFE